MQDLTTKARNRYKKLKKECRNFKRLDDPEYGKIIESEVDEK